MTLRFAGFAALALLSSACTYRTQAAAHEAAVDYSDHAYYDHSFGQSPSYQAPSGVAGNDSEAEAPLRGDQPAAQPARGNALGFAGNADNSVTTDGGSSVEFQEVEATPGTPCYEAAVKAGIQEGVCTLIVERKYLLVGEKAH
jgi:hypothetical protein